MAVGPSVAVTHSHPGLIFSSDVWLQTRKMCQEKAGSFCTPCSCIFPWLFFLAEGWRWSAGLDEFSDSHGSCVCDCCFFCDLLSWKTNCLLWTQCDDLLWGSWHVQPTDSLYWCCWILAWGDFHIQVTCKYLNSSLAVGTAARWCRYSQLN